MPLRRNTYKIHPLFVWLHAWCPEQTPQKQPHPHTMVWIWKLAPLAAPDTDVIQRPSTPQWAPPRPAIMPPLTSSGHSRGDCGTVQPEAEAHLEAHLNANLSASREADNVEAGGRQDDRAADRLAARLLRAARTWYLHCRCGRTSVWSPGRGAAGAARHWYWCFQTCVCFEARPSSGSDLSDSGSQSPATAAGAGTTGARADGSTRRGTETATVAGADGSRVTGARAAAAAA